MVKSLRLTWLRRLYSGEDAGWESYLRLLLKTYGGEFLFHCDHDPKDYDVANKFYFELVQFWAECRNAFSEEDGKASIIWNNKHIRQFFDKGLVSISQLQFQQNNLVSKETCEVTVQPSSMGWS